MDNNFSDDLLDFDFNLEQSDINLDNQSFNSESFVLDDIDILNKNTNNSDTSNTSNNNEFSFLKSNEKTNDIILDSNDAVDIENLNFNNYNRDIINTEKPSGNKKNLDNMNAIGNKKSYNEIEYKNEIYLKKDEKHQELSNKNNENSSEPSFYELEIEDYPDRANSLHSIDINNKSLGADNTTNFISKILDKIRSIITKK